VRLIFFEAPLFTRLLPLYLDDRQYQQLQLTLLKNPECGELIPGTGGFRKLRWQDRRRRKGKRGGLRIIYYYLKRDSQIWLFTLYGKEEALDLTAEEKGTLKHAIEAELRARRR
jgi:mRNA-degrading endonuclease RelE of RelBE toxin-antitoxin system